MDATRLRQINEGLGYDRNINARVFKNRQKKVTRYPDEPLDSQIDADMETATKEDVNALRVNLDNKYAILSVMLRPGISILSDQCSNAAREAFQIETVAQSCNKAIAPLASSKNQMFRQTTSHQLHELLNRIGMLRQGLIQLTHQMEEKKDGAGTHAHAFYVVRCIESLPAF